MSRLSVVIASVALSTVACGARGARTETASARTAPVSPAKTADAKGTIGQLRAGKTPSGAAATDRRVGDFFVYEVGGTFSREPIMLTERVVARENGAWIVDFTLSEGDDTTALRVTFSAEDPARPASVSRLGQKGARVVGTIAEYEALIEKTQLIPESNDEVLSADRTACLVGAESLDCDVSTYAVTVDGKPAILKVSHASDFARDVGGEIVTKAGTVLYRARLVDHGNDAPKSGVARVGRH